VGNANGGVGGVGGGRAGEGGRMRARDAANQPPPSGRRNALVALRGRRPSTAAALLSRPPARLPPTVHTTPHAVLVADPPSQTPYFHETVSRRFGRWSCILIVGKIWPRAVSDPMRRRGACVTLPSCGDAHLPRGAMPEGEGDVYRPLAPDGDARRCAWYRRCDRVALKIASS
jgi:hypothetical protein